VEEEGSFGFLCTLSEGADVFDVRTRGRLAVNKTGRARVQMEHADKQRQTRWSVRGSEGQREGRTAQATCVQPLAVFPTGKNLTVEKDRVPKNWSQIKRAGTEVRQELLQHWLYHGSKHYDVDRYGQHLHTPIKTLSRLTACQDHVPQDRLPTIATHAIPRARSGTASSIPNNIARHWGR